MELSWGLYNMELFYLYLWTRLDVLQESAKGFAVLITILLIMGIAASLIGYGTSHKGSNDYEFADKIMKSCLKVLLPISIFLILTTILLPTKKDAAVIAGGWVILKAAESEQGREIGSKLLTIIKGKLDEQIQDLVVQEAKKEIEKK